MFETSGNVYLKNPIVHSEYFWGPYEEVAGACVELVDQNPEGWCLCLVRVGDEVRGLMDVDPRDIERIERKPKTGDILTAFFSTLERLQQEGFL